MKKIAIGCGLVLLVVVIGGGIGSYVLYKKVKSTVADFTALGALPDIEREVANRTTFEPPASGELSEAQVSRLLQVQQQIRQRLGTEFAEFEKKYDALSKKIDRNEHTALDAPAIIAAYRDLAKTYVDAKRAQVQALNAAHFSLSEYQWVRQQAYAAIGVPIMNFDVSAFVEQVKAGNVNQTQPGRLEGSFGPTGPEKNQQLVQPHKKTLEDNAALSFFGL
jgi:hypothetical protein